MTAHWDAAHFESLVRPLWDYLAVSDSPRPADVIFVFGCRDLAVPARAVELYHDGHAAHVLLTGSFGRMTRGVFDKAEALVVRDHLVEAGVPEGAVITEPRAREHVGERTARHGGAQGPWSAGGFGAARGERLPHAPLHRDLRPAMQRCSCPGLPTARRDPAGPSTGARRHSPRALWPRSSASTATLPREIFAGRRSRRRSVRPSTKSELDWTRLRPAPISARDPCDRHGATPERRGDKPDHRGGQTRHACAAAAELHDDRYDDAPGDRPECLGRSDAAQVQTGQDRHEEADAQQRVEEAQHVDDRFRLRPPAPCRGCPQRRLPTEPRAIPGCRWRLVRRSADRGPVTTTSRA